MTQPINSIPLSLYIHLPWCVRKCPYCDFNSHAVKDELPEQAYSAALIADLKQDLIFIDSQRTIQSIFIGGGTPSLFSPQVIADLLTTITQHLNFADNIEITLEANPGTVEQERFTGFRQAGINRLSLGIQSLNDAHLHKLGRIHGRREALNAIEAAYNAGFDNINIDLMFGLPEQTVAQAMTDLEQAIALQPSHISHYQLTLEPNTLFYKYPPTLPDDDTTWAMQQQCQQQLAHSGYQHYEISAYAQPKQRCWHNLNYWQFGDYLGIGAGAHGKLTDETSGKVRRLWKIKHPQAYLKQTNSIHRLGGNTILSNEDMLFEFMLNALRLIDGIPIRLFGERTRQSLDSLNPALELAQQRELINITDTHITTTDLGQQFLNDLQALFLPETENA